MINLDFLQRVQYVVVPLHDHTHYINDCCKLINSEWKRSEAARIRSLEASSVDFPTSLVLLQKSSGVTKVVGHCKLSKVPFEVPSIFVESVVIHGELRGKGLGRFLMQETEQYLKRKNIKDIYLSTRGQEIFYAKLGYVECSPINIYGSSNVGKIINQHPITTSIISPVKTQGIPIPPPLPMYGNLNNTSNTVTSKTFMSKSLF